MSATNNGKLIVQAEDVIACVQALSKRGAQIHMAVIGELPTPRVIVNRRPAGVESGAKIIRGTGKGREEVHAATLNNCQVEWKETA